MTFSTEHYRFHYKETGTVGKEIAKVAEQQEECYAFLCACLRLSESVIIHYHFYDTAEEVGEQYALTHECDDDEPCNGFAIPDFKSKDKRNHIYAVYNEQTQCIGFHEDAHILSYRINRPESPFVREGLAMYFDRYWWGVDNASWTRWYLERGDMPSIKELFDYEIWGSHGCEKTYPIAGAFTEYLITRYGIDPYLEFYRICQKNAEESFRQAFGDSIEAVESEFIRYIALFRQREELKQLMGRLLSK